MPSGGAELWFKPMGGGQGYIFDSGEDADRNRISFLYEPGRGMVIRIFDANLEGKSSEYTYPCSLNAGRWYHLAGSWRGVGDLAVVYFQRADCLGCFHFTFSSVASSICSLCNQRATVLAVKQNFV